MRPRMKTPRLQRFSSRTSLPKRIQQWTLLRAASRLSTSSSCVGLRRWERDTAPGLLRKAALLIQQRMCPPAPAPTAGLA
jgi:hypothetical protein